MEQLGRLLMHDFTAWMAHLVSGSFRLGS